MLQHVFIMMRYVTHDVLRYIVTVSLTMKTHYKPPDLNKVSLL